MAAGFFFSCVLSGCREDTKSTTPRKTTGTWKSSRSAAKKQEPVSTGTGSGEDLDGSDGESDDKEMRDAPGNGSAEKPSGRAGKGSGSQGGSRGKGCPVWGQGMMQKYSALPAAPVLYVKHAVCQVVSLSPPIFPHFFPTRRLSPGVVLWTYACTARSTSLFALRSNLRILSLFLILGVADKIALDSQ